VVPACSAGPFPEQLITAAPEQFLRFIFGTWTAEPGVIDEDAFRVYLDAFAPAVAAICGDYRASFWLDREHDEDDRTSRRRIECLTLVITGAEERQLAARGRRLAG
jgi:haloacetate dehalogenase